MIIFFCFLTSRIESFAWGAELSTNQTSSRGSTGHVIHLSYANSGTLLSPNMRVVPIRGSSISTMNGSYFISTVHLFIAEMKSEPSIAEIGRHATGSPRANNICPGQVIELGRQIQGHKPSQDSTSSALFLVKAKQKPKAVFFPSSEAQDFSLLVL